jgi:hypothetical protein
MNPRHTAALALVGWYLMYPIDVPDNAPVSEWTHGAATFRSKGDCEKSAESELADCKENQETMTMLNAMYCRALFAKRTQCVGNDDPRLKRN